MVVETIFEEEKRETITASKEIKSNVKDISSLFKYIASVLAEENLNVKEMNEKVLRLSKKEGFQKLEVFVKDIDEENLFSIEVHFSSFSFPDPIQYWMQKRTLRLKNSAWFLLILIVAILTPFVVLGILERYDITKLGIGLISSSVGAVILYFIINRFIPNRKVSQKSKAEVILKQVEKIISQFHYQEIPVRKCWNCFFELKENQTTCPQCKVSL